MQEINSEILPSGKVLTHEKELEILKKLGFPINPFNKKVNSIQEVWEEAGLIQNKRENLPYPIDGLVVKLNNNKLFEDLGVVGKTPRGWCAVKFPAEEITTRLLSVSWNVGRTGKVTPVADLEPVKLDGTTVKRATLHNYKEFELNNLHELDTLIIRKAGDIIPEVVQVLDNLRHQNSEKFEAPSVCPVCKTELIFSNTNVDLECPNSDNCPTQVIRRLAYFCKRNLGNISGLSEKQIEKFVEEFGIKDVPDLYNLPWEKIQNMEGFGEKSVQNLKDSIQKAMHITDYKFLAGLGIDGIGPEVAKLICTLL